MSNSKSRFVYFAEDIAQVCHDANASWCRVMGDNSQPSWESAPEWQRNSAIVGVKFHISSPDAKASSSHESWVKQKVSDGWKYGPEKDPDKKEHPCIVPFESLPFNQKIKDFIFRAIVHAFIDSKMEDELCILDPKPADDTTKPSAFLICPVRGQDPSALAEVVREIETTYALHYPPRDTEQSDPVGLEICKRNREAIAGADVVFVVWDGQSQGCLFDLGMAFALGKRVEAVRLPDPSHGKSFQNMVRAWCVAGGTAG